MDILISACLLGYACRYDGKDNYIENFFEKHKDLNFIKICPEVESGMTTPRRPSEIKNNKVFDNLNNDNTDFFEKGANIALKRALDNNIKVALLKSKSPSCGKGLIYDGSFTKTLIKGDGFTARLLKNKGIQVFTEKELDDFDNCIKIFKSKLWFFNIWLNSIKKSLILFDIY